MELTKSACFCVRPRQPKCGRRGTWHDFFKDAILRVPFFRIDHKTRVIVDFVFNAPLGSVKGPQR